MKRLPQRFETADIVAQNIESKKYMAFADAYIGSRFVREFPFRPDGWDEHYQSDTAYCMGIFGGQRVDVIREYAEQVLKMVESADWNIVRRSSVPMHLMNVIFEQQVAYCFLETRNITPTFILNPHEMQDSYTNGNNVGFIHLQGRRYWDKQQTNGLLKHLSDEYPETMERVWRLLPETAHLPAGSPVEQKWETFVKALPEKQFITSPPPGAKVVKKCNGCSREK